MDVEAFVTELRTLPPKEAVIRAREAAHSTAAHILFQNAEFRKWVVEVDNAGHLDWDDRSN